MPTTQSRQKEHYEYCEKFLTIVVGITAVVGLIFYSFLDNLGLFSYILIILYILFFVAMCIFSTISIVKKDNNLAKIVFILFIAIVIVAAVFAIIFVTYKSGFNMKIVFNHPNLTNIITINQTN